VKDGRHLKDWIDRFDGLKRLDETIKDRLHQRGQIRSFPAGTLLFGPGKSPTHLLLLLSGTVRVQKQSESGREIVLYRVNAGDSCVMTSACLLTYDGGINAEGIAETDIEAVAIPRTEFDNLIATSSEFRNFVFSAYSKRIADLFFIIDEIAFKRLDIRLAQRLLDMPAKGNVLKITHQRLAAELGTAREVVTRQLQEFQRRGWIALSRGAISVTDAEALLEISNSA
jgi:CRP/FNR family transcriptional regulator